MTIGKILTQTSITVYVRGEKPFTMARSHKLFGKLKDAVTSGDEAEIRNVINMALTVTNYLQGHVTVQDGQIFYGTEEITGPLADRILSLIDEDEDAGYLIKFLENLMENPSKQSREQLYLFLEACDHPITEDGRFVAYKWVRENYRDSHSGKFDNSVGQIVSMPRRDVDDNRQVTCSTGLHVCSAHYSKFAEKLMLVAVNPKDVVSVPDDYNNGKMRVCEYEVIDEIAENDYINFQGSVYRKVASAS